MANQLEKIVASSIRNISNLKYDPHIVKLFHQGNIILVKKNSGSDLVPASEIVDIPDIDVFHAKSVFDC